MADGGLIKDGYLYLKDRIKDTVVTGGENVYSGEVESLLAQHPGTADVAVPSQRGGETVLASSCGTGGRCDRACAHHACGLQVPTIVEFVDVLPRNATCKVRNDVLRQAFRRSSDRPAGTV